ncbi:MAG: hypothetical protein FWF22_04810 [Treponema sp.]|nr:hypothetical protein [Treponema sp.]
MRKMFLVVFAASLTFLFLLESCSSPANGIGEYAGDLRAAEESGLIAGSGAGLAGWAVDDVDFPKNAAGTVKDGVIRMGPDAWTMALMFNDETATRIPAEGAVPVEYGVKWVTVDPVVHPEESEWVKAVKEWVPPVKEWVPAVKEWIDPVYNWVDPEYKWVDAVVENVYPKKDIFGFTDIQWYSDFDDRIAKYGDGAASYAGWSAGDHFPKYEKGKIVEYNGVVRNGQSAWSMAVAFNGESRTVDLINGQAKRTGMVDFELIENGTIAKVTVRGYRAEDIGKILQVCMYPEWNTVSKPVVGLGNFNGNDYHNEAVAYFDWDQDFGTMYFTVHAKANPYLGMWGKIGEADDLNAVPTVVVITPGYYSDEIAKDGYYGSEVVENGYWKVIKPGYNKIVEKGCWKTITPGFYRVISDSWLETFDLIEVTDYDNVLVWSAWDLVQAVNIIEGQDHVIGQFVVKADTEGAVTLSWRFDAKSQKSHIQYIAFTDMFDNCKLPGLGKWTENKNVLSDENGVFTITVPGYVYDGGTFYVAAHCSNAN